MTPLKLETKAAREEKEGWMGGMGGTWREGRKEGRIEEKGKQLYFNLVN